jgi:hypothetical protein
MPLVFRQLHPASTPDALNEEWMLLENTGPTAVSVAGCTLMVSKNAAQRPRSLGALEPGFILQPNEQIRIVTGSPSKKAQGVPPEESGVKNYYLFLRERVLAQPGLIVRLSLKQHDLVKAVFTPGE